MYEQTGGSAGSCPECKMGQGADNGIGGRVQEKYGDPALIGQQDPQLYGHVYSLDHKLAACSSKVREEFAIMEGIVNEACNVQSYQRLKRCGNCANAICQFHNNLHWISNPSYKCTMVSFLHIFQPTNVYHSQASNICHSQASIVVFAGGFPRPPAFCASIPPCSCT